MTLLTWDLDLIRPSEAANDYYMTIVYKSKEEYELIEKQINNYKALLNKDKERKIFYNDQIEKWSEKQTNFKHFGYEGIISEKHPTLEDNKAKLGELFFRKYGRYRMGYSSYVEFQDQLQLLYDTIADYYEDRFKASNLYNQYFDEESQKEDAFSSRSETTMENDSKGVSKDASLPDVDVENITYTSKAQQNSASKGNVKVSDTSFLTKMAGISGYLSFDRYLIRDYLNEFNPLFQTIIW